MAFPAIGASAQSAFSGGTSAVDATNPGGITAGQLLVAWVALQGTTTRTTPTGWTSLGTALAGGAHRVYLFARVATADAGDTLTLDRSGGSAYVSFAVSRITDWFGSIGDGVDAGARTITNNGSAALTAVTGDPGGFTGINFGAVSPAWGSADTLWFGGVALESSNLTDPASYTQAYWHDNSGTSHNLEAWSRQNATASEDPPLFGSAGANIAAFFIAVRPASAADTTPPTLTSPSGTGGLGVCSGSVSTDEGNGTLYAVATASATAPSAAQVKAGQDHTSTAALRVVSQAVSGTGTQTIASGAITGGAGTRYLHFMHEDAAANQSTVSSSAGFTITAAATTLTVALKLSDGTTPAASLTGIEAVVLNAATLGAATAVVDSYTGESTDSGGNLVLDITGLGITVGAVRYVVSGDSDGTVGADFDGWHGPATAA